MPESKNGKRKIFIVGPTESILTKRGNRHPALAQFLVEQGYDLEYVASNFYHAEKRWFSKEEIKAAKQHVPYKLIVMKCLGYQNNISLRRILSNMLLSLVLFVYLLPRLNKKTILILPSRPVEMIFAAALLRLFRGNSVALDIQDIWPDMLVVKSRMKRLAFRLYCNLYLYISLRFIDKFFHVAPSFENWLHRYAPKAKSTFIPLGFDKDRWSEQQDGSAKGGDGSRLVSVSQLTFQFDVLPVLKAIVSSKSHRLTVIGENGKGERYPEVLKFINENKMKNVEIIGHVDRKELASYLGNSDIGVVPMVSTSLPNKVFDYLASYLPILVLGENDIARFVREHDIGWCAAFEEKEIRDLLKSISKEQIVQKRENIREIRHIYDRDNLHKQLLDLIES